MTIKVRAAAPAWGIRCRLAALGLLALLTAGCMSPGVLSGLGLPWEHPDERPSKIMAYWDREVRGAPDSNSTPLQIYPCLAGRVYFFGADPSQLITPRGKLVVDWYDMSGPPNAEHKLLGECVYDPDSLQKVVSKNMIGVGYTVVAPWYNYRPDVTRVKIVLAFLPEKGGGVVYAEPSVVSLQHEGPKVLSSQREELFLTPGAPQVQPAPTPPGLGPPPSQPLPPPRQLQAPPTPFKQ